jgi:DNA-binding NtrC family response regulator
VSEWDPADAKRTDTVTPSYRPRIPTALRLLVLSGPDRGAEIALGPGKHLVGKAPECGLVLSDGGVSRQHLELEVLSDGVIVRDLGSTNGAFFGGARFREVTVGAGAVITIGSTELKLTAAADSEGLPPSTAGRFGRLVGSSLRMREIYALLERVAQSDAVVLIEGETGTGKEVCAEAIHAAGTRAQGPFVLCDLSSVSRSLLESELFGHVRGAFTGADRDRDGVFVQAHGGTIFLDEIGELELDMQPRLLRTIEQRRVKRVGDGKFREVDARVIAATNRDLAEEVSAGRFREDLFHRLAVVRVRLPPLRERKEDLPTLVAELDPSLVIPDETMAVFMDYDWPGNVRELKNVLERARSLGEKILKPGLLSLSPNEPPTVDLGPLDWGKIGSEGFAVAKEKLMNAWERKFVTELLKRTNGNVMQAAREGGIDRAYLYKLMKKLGM